mgnify:CR=1 FL=1|jgi:hypothetical protein
MAKITVKQVQQRVTNAVHGLCKELETAGVDVSAVVVEETADGITVRVEKTRKMSRGPAKVESVDDLPEIGLDADGAAVFLENEDDGSTGDK